MSKSAATFSERLISAIQRTGTAVVVGLDPNPELMPTSCFNGIRFFDSPASIEELADRVLQFNIAILDAVSDIVPAVKPQSAFYERLGFPGLRVLRQTMLEANRRGLVVILDAKRNDIESTAAAYADAYLGETMFPGTNIGFRAFPCDALTVNPLLGTDSILPFIDEMVRHQRGVFVLVRTSNPSSVDFQDALITTAPDKQIPLAHLVAEHVNRWGSDLLGDNGYSQIGAVVGATFPQEAGVLRRLMPAAFLLVPGIGAQGGDPEMLSSFFNPDGLGALVSASRSVIYAFRSPSFSHLSYPDAARQATLQLRGWVDRARRSAARSHL